VLDGGSLYVLEGHIRGFNLLLPEDNASAALRIAFSTVSLTKKKISMASKDYHMFTVANFSSKILKVSDTNSSRVFTREELINFVTGHVQVLSS
jgi:hypothetical protein